MVSIILNIILIFIIVINYLDRKDRISEYRKQVYQEFEQNRFEETVALCNKLLVLSPEDEAIKLLLRNSQDAIKERYQNIQIEKALAIVKADRIQKANERRQKAKSLLDRINAPIFIGTPDDKIKASEEALQIDPDYGDAYQVMGYAYKEKAVEDGKSPDVTSGELIDKALECFSKAIEKAPTLVYSYYERAFITAFINNNPEGAMVDFNKVIELDPNSPIAYFARGIISYYQKDYDNAIVHFNKAIDLKPDYIESYLNLGSAYSQKGKFDKAIKEINRAIELKPGNATAYYNRGSIYFQQGEYDRAILNFTRAIEFKPDYISAYNNRGNAYKESGDFKAAIKDFTKAIELKTDNASPSPCPQGLGSIYYNRAIVYVQLNQPEQAITDFNKTIELEPDYADAYYQLSLVYAGKNEFDRAIFYGDNFLKIAPNHPKAAEMQQFIEKWNSKK